MQTYTLLWGVAFGLALPAIVVLGNPKVSTRAKSIAIIYLAVVLLAMDWAALHDIMAGEPDPYGEYAILLMSPFAFVILGWAWLRRKDKRPEEESG